MDKRPTMTVQEAARLLNMKEQTIRAGIESGALRFGDCIRGGQRNKYVIYRHQFEQITGIKTKEEQDGVTKD